LQHGRLIFTFLTFLALAAALCVAVYFGTAAGLWVYQPPRAKIADVPADIRRRLQSYCVQLPPSARFVHAEEGAAEYEVWAQISVPPETVDATKETLRRYATRVCPPWTFDDADVPWPGQRLGFAEPEWWRPNTLSDADTFMIWRRYGIFVVASKREGQMYVLFFPDRIPQAPSQ
jgi:hypothetical protein